MTAKDKSDVWHSINSIRKHIFSLLFNEEINVGEWTILESISAKNSCSEKNACVSDLHSEMMISKPAVSQILNSLEKKGLVTRELHSQDRRKIQLALTPYAEEVIRKSKEKSNKIFDEIAERFGQNQVEQLVLTLNKLASVLAEMDNNSAQETGNR